MGLESSWVFFVEQQEKETTRRSASHWGLVLLDFFLVCTGLGSSPYIRWKPLLRDLQQVNEDLSLREGDGGELKLRDASRNLLPPASSPEQTFPENSSRSTSQGFKKIGPSKFF